MATILLSAAGAALGGSLGGSFLGLSGAVLGRALGATVGRVIDQRLLGAGSQVIETGRLQRYRVTGASEGAPVANVWGRMRVGGQVIWSTRFNEKKSSSGGGKGGGGPRVRSYKYSVSVAVAVCEGEITRVGRIWADGIELPRDRVNMRVYSGSEDQLPDPLIEAVEGVGRAPAYRGIAYVVFEDLQLGEFGNRVPQFSFEVVRPVDGDLVPEEAQSVSGLIRGVALMPGSGEYALATTRVRVKDDLGWSKVLNYNTPSGKSDLQTSLDHLQEELPNCGSALLVVSWFGDDLRCGSCTLRPLVEQKDEEGAPMPWSVSGLDRETADTVAQADDRPIYGGTPTDQSVIEAIQALKNAGQKVVFYPFILMTQSEGNTLPDPWTGMTGQAHLPWRGRITTSLAPGLPASPDKTPAAEVEVAQFVGQAHVSDFPETDEGIGYSGPPEWSYRRFILHYAHLCAKAGGVDTFSIGSEMRGLTQIRTAGHRFPAVEALKQLAAEVKVILGPDTKITYCADWSEYFGYRPTDGSGDLYFHLDPLWSDPNIDVIGIDNYMPLSDWREETGHADSDWGSIYNPAYLEANVAGGEGYDWYYQDAAGRAEQDRIPIEDGALSFPDLTPARSIPESLGDTLTSADFGGAGTAIADASFSIRLVLPATPSDGVVVLRGGGTAAMYLGVRGGGNTLRLRAGDSSVGGSVATAVLDLPVGSLPFDGHLHELTWDIHVTTGEIRLWCDGELVGTSVAASGGFSAWADAGPGMVGGGGIAATGGLAGEPSLPWPAPMPEPLRMYDETFVQAAEAEPWVFRYKDLRNWWSRRHRERRGGAPLMQSTTWEPQSKPIWFTEFGCGAVDKGTNQPNKFVDPKSSESQLPYFSSGAPDDYIQAQYLRASMRFWSDVANNPISSVYGEQMVDVSRAHAWAWDTRPWPHFPALTELWSDGENYRLGHWLNGRISSESLAGVVAELCTRAGIASYDVSELRGLVRGFQVGEVGTTRAALQPLMLGYGVDAAEREGLLRFTMRDTASGVPVDDAELVLSDEHTGRPERIRAAESELSGRVRVTHVLAGGDFEAASSEAVLPDDSGTSVSQSELPLALTRSEGRQVAERWLAEANVARDSVRMVLPRSHMSLGAGDVVELNDGGSRGLYRIDQMEIGSGQVVEAVRVEPPVHQPAAPVEERILPRPWRATGPVSASFLDLPLLTGGDDPAAPYLAVAADPWPGDVAVYSSTIDAGYSLLSVLETPALVGVTLNALDAAQPGIWDRGPALLVRVRGGELSSSEMEPLFAGANAAAIGDGSSTNWEIFQFREAVLVAADTYALSMRLRGQLGTDALSPQQWAPGSRFLLLDDAVTQLPVAADDRGLARNYRVGPADVSFDDDRYAHLVETFNGVGMRPYAPVHVRAVRSGGDLAATWVRRSRVDGDSWVLPDVPLGEASERYFVTVVKDGVPVRHWETTTPNWTYSAEQQDVDGVSIPFSLEIAQVSDRFGPGLKRRIDIND